MPLSFELVGRNKNNLDQDDRIDRYNLLREFFRRTENEDVATFLDTEDVHSNVKNAPMPSQLAIKNFTTIALKSPATNFDKYQPQLAELNLGYIKVIITVKKRDFVDTYA